MRWFVRAGAVGCIAVLSACGGGSDVVTSSPAQAPATEAVPELPIGPDCGAITATKVEEILGIGVVVAASPTVIEDTTLLPEGVLRSTNCGFDGTNLGGLVNVLVSEFPDQAAAVRAFALTAETAIRPIDGIGDRTVVLGDDGSWQIATLSGDRVLIVTAFPIGDDPAPTEDQITTLLRLAVDAFG